ncbi:N-formylglutamate amidohydrolase [Geminicoccaceae bacterium 1502E]|nr:N-formylglutamate amidohydrolase [Geminicoccaceae bacterium 1502E]
MEYTLEQLTGVYTVKTPTRNVAPLLVEVPRSGREYPCDFRVAASFEVLHAYVSMYVEEIYSLAPDAGARLFWAHFPNSFVDANRPIDDIDPDLLEGEWPTPLNPTDKSIRLGTGLIHKWGRADTPLYDRKLGIAEVSRRIENYYVPYHRKLADLIKENVDKHGASWHLSCHCMATVGPHYSHDKGQQRRDICLSDLNGETSSPEFMHISKEAFEAEGFSVSINDPFVGNVCIARHSDVEHNRNSIQIEMTKGLYMDEVNFEKLECFDEIQARFGAVLARISDYCREQTP